MITFKLGSLVLVLPSPRLNDTESLIIPAIIDRAKDGTIWAFKKQSTALQRLSLYFEHTNRPKVIETIAFLRQTMGKTIQYTDYEGGVWSGKILTTPFTATHTGIRNNTFNLDFEGRKQ